MSVRVKRVLFYIFLIILPYILLSPSLKKDWALLNDPDMMTWGLRAVKGIFCHFDFTPLYPPSDVAGGRFRPGYFLYAGIRGSLIGLSPYKNHLFVLGLLYLHLLLMHYFIHGATRQYRYSALGICLYLFYAQGGWCTAYYTWYSLITTEPVLVVLLMFSLAFFLAANRIDERHKARVLILLACSVVLMGFAFFTKEPTFAYTGAAGVILLLTYWRRGNAFGLSPTLPTPPKRLRRSGHSCGDGARRTLAAIYFAGAIFFALLFILIYKHLSAARPAAYYTAHYRFSAGYLVHQTVTIVYRMFQNYTVLLFLLPALFALRIYISLKDGDPLGRREMLQIIFLVWCICACGILLPWEELLERYLTIPTLCFAIFGALEASGSAEFLLKSHMARIQKTAHGFAASFWVMAGCGFLLFIFGKVLMPQKIYAWMLKFILVGLILLITIRILTQFYKNGKMERLCLHIIIFLFTSGFLLFLFIGSMGAYNFNHKYDGIEEVLVRMVRKVARGAVPNAGIYFHLPEGHTYIGQMNYRLPLFENRPDLKAFAFSDKPGAQYQKGDIIIHHPWLSGTDRFPFFEYKGEISQVEPVRCIHPYIAGATYSELKRWLIAHATFPRDPRLPFLEKQPQQNWWEIYVVLSDTLTITGGKKG
jgi:hypothetical protein